MLRKQFPIIVMVTLNLRLGVCHIECVRIYPNVQKTLGDKVLAQRNTETNSSNRIILFVNPSLLIGIFTLKNNIITGITSCRSENTIFTNSIWAPINTPWLILHGH